jgi:hypothetical protein
MTMRAAAGRFHAGVGTVNTPAEPRTAAQNEKIALSDELIGELETASE